MFTAVITLTELREDPTNSVESIVKNKDHFKNVIFVNPCENNVHSHIEKLQKASLRVREVSELIPADFADSSTILHIPPFTQVKVGALDNIAQTVRNSNEYQTDYSLTPRIEREKSWSFFDGFLIVALTIEWFWGAFFERWKNNQFTDLRAQEIIRKGGRQILSTPRYSWYFVNPTVIPKNYADPGTATTQVPDKFPLAYWVLRNHLYFRWGLWLVPFLFCCWFAEVFWILGVIAYIRVAFGEFLPLFLIIATLAFQWISGWLASRRVFQNPLLCLFFPFYFATFPFYLVYTKL